EMHVGSDFALSELRLAECLQNDVEEYLLHPCLLDGALQTIIGMAAADGDGVPHVPFAIGAIDILGPLPEVCFAYVQRSAGVASDDVMMFDVHLLNGAGKVLLKLTKFYVRALITRDKRELD